MKELNLSRHQKKALALAQTAGGLQRDSKHYWCPSVEKAHERRQKLKKEIGRFYKDHPRLREHSGFPPQEIRNLESKHWQWEADNCIGTQTVLSLVRRGLMRWTGPDWVDNNFWYELKLLQ